MKVRSNNIEREAIQYTDPASVEKIMDMFGTNEINNTTEGLWFIDELIPKGCWLIKGDNKIVHIMDDSAFKDLFEVVNA